MTLMRRLLKPLLAASLMLMTQAQAATAVETHGALSVKGNQIVGSHGKRVSLAGPSLFWSNTGWIGSEYYTAGAVAYTQRSWNAGIIRAAIGADKNGGLQADWAANMARLETVVDAAIAQGLYVLVDYHSHDAEKHPEQAIKFFETVARKYGKHPNLIYEIYNEPLKDTDWSTVVKPYAEKLIPRIRAIDPNNLIVVGTPAWSQDVDKAARDPLKGFSNIVYTLHFYAGSHKQWLRDKAKFALDQGLALMVTEWGAVNANGDGAIDREETERWLAFMREHHISHLQWTLGSKRESASQLKPGTPPTGQWTDADLTEGGLYFQQIVRGWSPVKFSGAK